MGRTVGAALRGRPWLAHRVQDATVSISRTRFKPRAATESRPYSTFRNILFDVEEIAALDSCEGTVVSEAKHLDCILSGT